MDANKDASDSFLNSDFLNDEFFIEIVKRKLNIKREEFKLRLVYISPATGKNENFASVVYRAKIYIELIKTKEKKFVDVILKALLITIEMLEEMSLFEREKVFYNDVLESLEKIYKEPITFGPKCFKIASKPFEVIVLDDLKASGYEMLDKKIGANYEQSKLVMMKLAKFHAASAVRYQKDGQISAYFDRFAILSNTKLISTDQMEKSTKTYQFLFKHFTEVISTIGGCEKEAAKIKNWDMMKAFNVYLASAEPMSCGLRVLNHGDGWLNNMMFKFDENKNAIDTLFIDFQLPFWGSPAYDLIYFFIASVENEVKTKHFDDLIEIYHSELAKSLKCCGYDQHIPVLSEIHTDLLEKGGIFGFYILYVLIVIKYNSTEDLSIEMLMDSTKYDEKIVKNIFDNELYKEALKTWLPFLNKRGFLDTLLPNAPITPFIQNLMQQFEAAAAAATLNN